MEVVTNTNSSSAAVDLTPVTDLLTQILALLNTIIGLLPPIGRSLDDNVFGYPLGKNVKNTC